MLWVALTAFMLLAIVVYDWLRHEFFPPPPEIAAAKVRLHVDMSEFPADELMNLNGAEFDVQVGQKIVLTAAGEAFMGIERVS